MNTDFSQNVRGMANTGFNEAGWLFPSSDSTDGECDSYVKMNITEPNMPWDYGSMSRSAWTDQSILGGPISGTPTGIIYSQESTRDADGQPMSSSFSSGYFYIAEGEEFSFVDQIIPDMKWDFFGGSSSAQVTITINAINYPGDTPDTYGPYTMNSTTQYISTRIRARQMSVTVMSADSGSFWRLGKIRYRYAPIGRR
jgi:V8-like Glu-specific endopeptidase